MQLMVQLNLHMSKKSCNFAAESCKEYLKQRIYYYVVHFNSYGLVMFNWAVQTIVPARNSLEAYGKK